MKEAETATEKGFWKSIQVEKETWRIWKKKDILERSMCVYIEEGEQKDDTPGTWRSVQTRLKIKRGNFILFFFIYIFLE